MSSTHASLTSSPRHTKRSSKASVATEEQRAVDKITADSREKHERTAIGARHSESEWGEKSRATSGPLDRIAPLLCTCAPSSLAEQRIPNPRCTRFDSSGVCNAFAVPTSEGG